jgi:hypothetical protein
MTASGDASLPLATEALLAATPPASTAATCRPVLDSLHRSDGRIRSLATNLKKIELLTLQRRHRAYAPRRSLFALMIPLPVLWHYLDGNLNCSFCI